MSDTRERQSPQGMGHRNRVAPMWLMFGLLVVGFAGVSWWDANHVTVEAPNFSLVSTGYENGVQGEPVPFNLTDYAGKTVVLDFMAVTCTSCRVLTREVLEPLYEEFGERDDFVLLSIDTWADPDTGSALFGGETREELIKLQKSENVPWRHALDTDDVYQKYVAIALPKISIVNPDGMIVYEASGIPPLSQVRAEVEASLDGNSNNANVLRVGLLGLAMLAGLASFFSPCSVGLIPAYMGFLLQGNPTPGRTLRGGVTTALGIVTVYAAIAGLLALLATLGYDAVLREHLPKLNPIMGGLLVVLGVLMFFKVSWDWVAKKLGMGKVDGRKGFYLFGLGYGLAAFGCTGPIFLPVLLAGFLAGIGMGILVFFLYAVSIASLVMLAAVLVATGQEGRLKNILGHTERITKVSAALLVGAGLYLIWFDWRAGVLAF